MTREESLAFMRDPNRWPRWPRLSLTRREVGFPLLGFIIDTDPPEKYNVYIGNVFESKADDWEDYSSYEEILDDGWEVD